MRLLRFVPLLALACTIRAFAGVPTVPSLEHQRVLVLGDSITQDGRYVTYLEYYLHRLAPATGCDLISIGLGSETVSGLTEPGHPYPRPWALERLGRALAAVKPTVVFACYGMNDGIYHPASPERRAAFAAGLQQLITQVRAGGARLVLLTPPIFDARSVREKTVPAGAPAFGYGHFFEGYDSVLAEFAAAELALRAQDLKVIDVHRAMADALAAAKIADPAATFSPDGVHPNDAGHLVIARAILAGLDLPVAAVSLDAELKRVASDPLFALVRDRRSLRSEAWLPFVGYTRGPSFKSESVTAAERVAAGLAQQIEALAAK